MAWPSETRRRRARVDTARAPRLEDSPEHAIFFHENGIAMNGSRRHELSAAGLSCAGDAPVLARKLEKLPGVVAALVNPVTETAYIDVEEGTFSLEDATRVMREFGCRPGD